MLASRSNRGATNPCQFVGNVNISFPRSGKTAVFDKTDLLVMSPVLRFHCCPQHRRTDCLLWGRSCVELPKERSTAHARQEELNMIHYPRAAAFLFTCLRAEESSDFKIAVSLCTITFRRKSGRFQAELEFKKS